MRYVLGTPAAGPIGMPFEAEDDEAANAIVEAQGETVLDDMYWNLDGEEVILLVVADEKPYDLT
jgi:hypothetical protein